MTKAVSMTNLNLNSLCNTHVFRCKENTVSYGQPSQYDVADIVHLGATEDVAKLLVANLNSHYIKLSNWVNQVGFLTDNPVSIITEQFPCLVLAKNEQDDTPAYVVNMFDFLVWDQQAQKLVLVDNRKVLCVFCYEKTQNDFFNAVFQECQKRQDFTHFLCSELEIRLAEDLQENGLLYSRVNVFWVQQILFLMLQKHQEEIHSLYPIRSYQYIDNIIEGLRTPHLLNQQAFRSYIKQVFDDRDLPIPSHNNDGFMTLQAFYGLCDALAPHLALKAHQLMLLAMLLGLRKEVPNFPLFVGKPEPDLSVLEKYIQELLLNDNPLSKRPTHEVLYKMGIPISLPISLPIMEKTNWEYTLYAFYDLMAELTKCLSFILQDNRLAQDIISSLVYRTNLHYFYFPQAHSFCKTVLGTYGLNTTLIKFDDYLEERLVFLFQSIKKSEEMVSISSLTIRKLINLIHEHISTYDSKQMVEYLSKLHHHNDRKISLVDILLFEEPAWFTKLNTNIISLKTWNEELESDRQHVITTNDGHLGAIFVFGPVFTMGQIDSLLGYLRHTVQHNPFFLWQLPQGIDVFDEHLLEFMRCKIQNKETQPFSLPLQMKLLGKLQKHILSYYQSDNLFDPRGGRRGRYLSNYIYLDESKTMVGVMCYHEPINAETVFSNMVKNRNRIIRSLSGLSSDISTQIGWSEHNHMLELKYLASKGADAAFYNGLDSDEQHLYIYKKQIEKLVVQDGSDTHLLNILNYCNTLLLGAVPAFVIKNIDNQQSLQDKLHLPLGNMPSLYFKSEDQIAVICLSRLPPLQALHSPIIWDVYVAGSDAAKLNISGQVLFDHIIGNAGELGVHTHNVRVQVKQDGEVWQHRHSHEIIGEFRYLHKNDFMRLFQNSFAYYPMVENKLMIVPYDEVRADLGDSLVDTLF